MNPDTRRDIGRAALRWLPEVFKAIGKAWRKRRERKAEKRRRRELERETPEPPNEVDDR